MGPSNKGSKGSSKNATFSSLITLKIVIKVPMVQRARILKIMDCSRQSYFSYPQNETYLNAFI